MRRKKFWLLGALLATLAAVAVWAWVPGGVNNATASLAIFKVENLTCGSCVKNIQTALADADGVAGVDVSVTSGRSEVRFDPAKLSPEQIAEMISKAGYPAAVSEVLSASDVRDLSAENGRLSQQYVARIGNRLLPRAEFEANVERLAAGLAAPVAAEQMTQLRLQAWRELLQRELLLGAAEAHQVVVQDGEVTAEIEKMQAGHAGMQQLVEKRFGDMQAFARQLKQELIIQRHLERNVASAELPPEQRQQLLAEWYRQLVQETPQVIFDPELKAAGSSAGSGCGGSCCG